MRSRGPDRMLLLFTGLLLLYGLMVLYSAGQTDTPTNAGGAWTRQLVWVGAASVAGFLAFQTSPRILEWIAPGVYLAALGLLVLTLIIGTGAGTAAGTSSWLTIGGVRVGQPAELAKLATVLFLARYLSSMREPPDTLRREEEAHGRRRQQHFRRSTVHRFQRPGQSSGLGAPDRRFAFRRLRPG